jgi:O-antigen ligase
VRRLSLVAAAAVLLALPPVLAWFDGGYRDVPRIVAGAVAWGLVAVAAVAASRPLPRHAAGRAALAGLAALFALTLASVTWAPLAAPAYADAQRVALYLGVLVAASAVVPLAVAVPALAAAATAIVLAGLSERLVPDLVTLERSLSAGGRLAAPLGYWNAMGAVAALGLVLCAGVAGDRAAPRWLRRAAAACAPALGAALALTFSRGGLLAAAAGLAVLVAARPYRSQLRAALLVGGAAAVAGGLAAALPAVGDLDAADGARAAQGAVLAAAIVVAAAVAAWLAGWTRGGGASRAERPADGDAGRAADRDARLRLPRPRVVIAGLIVLACGGVAVVAAADTAPREPRFGATPERLASLQSPRYGYWRVALETWADHPLAGAGASAFQVEWLRRRTEPGAARDAHSLPLETAAELGLAGLLALVVLVAGVVASGVALQRRAPGAGAAAFGALAAWAVHAAIDWGWEMPAVSLFAVLLAGAIAGSVTAERERDDRRGGRQLDGQDEHRERLGAAGAGQQHRLQHRRQPQDGEEGAPV